MVTLSSSSSSFQHLLVLVLLILSVSCQKKKAEPTITIEEITKPDDCPQQAQDGDTVYIHYTGSLASSGKVFDTSKERGEPMAVQLGTGRTIPGFEQGLRGMCVGQSRKVTIPPELAYGDKGVSPLIPPRSTLVFELECMHIDRPTIVRDFVPFLQAVLPVFLLIGVVVYLYYRAQSASTPTTQPKADKKKRKAN
eukprot:TRINITY_DN675_c0_g1_i3.p1 TRINITY_DN675_c0_g1~~TRINITY_DN675_c0_g1_i3.p1  ORF type:complete len:195 (+),score=38.50 TRINITY_DN675_c0_g1_i3:79-663(+)